jgi:putative FmdB family regulatory protein
MPIYVWKCPNCGVRLDLLQKVGAKAPECPECDTVMKQIIQPSGFRIKGSSGNHRLVEQESFDNDWGDD